MERLLSGESLPAEESEAAARRQRFVTWLVLALASLVLVAAAALYVNRPFVDAVLLWATDSQQQRPTSAFSLLLLDRPAASSGASFHVQRVNTSDIEASVTPVGSFDSHSNHSHLPPPASPLLPLTSIPCACMLNQSSSAAQYLLVQLEPTVLQAVLPRHSDRLSLLSQLRQVSASLCIPLLAYVWLPPAVGVKRPNGSIDTAAVYLHALLHELPSFVDRVVAADGVEALTLTRTFHVPPAHLALLPSVHSTPWMLSVSNTSATFLPAASLLLDELLEVTLQTRLDPSTASNYTLTAPSLQQRYVEAIRDTMAAPADCEHAVNRSQQFTVDASELKWNEADSHSRLASLSCSDSPPVPCPASAATIALLHSSHSVHITGEYSYAQTAASGCELQSITIVLGPIQQVVEVYRNVSTQRVVISIDGVELRREAVWPLNNKGNVTRDQDHISMQLAAPARGALDDRPTEPLFAYHFTIFIEQPSDTDPTKPLCTSLQLTRFLSCQAELGVLADGWRLDYLQQASVARSNNTPSWSKQWATSGTIVEPAFGLDVQQFTVSGLSLFSYPLMASRELPVTSVSFFPLSCFHPRYVIPRLIHETWFGPLIPAWLWINSWRRDYLQRHPGWVFLLWRSDSVRHLHYLDHYLWDMEKTYNGMSDVSRTAAARAYGGMYIDADSLSLEARPLDELYLAANSTGFFIAREKPNFDLFAAGVFGTTPNHDVMRRFQDWQHRNTRAQPN